MKERFFTIVNENELARDNVLQIIEKIKAVEHDRIIVFSVKPEQLAETGLETIQIPAECNNRPKMKNFVVNYFKKAGFKGHLHEIEDKVEILQDPSKLVHDIENMMNVLDMNCWFGTVTDVCNYLYQKYNPRLSIKIDKPEYQQLSLDEVVFCSHSNVQWMAYDLEKADDDELYFDEKFTIDMFWIIEFLARRRNAHPNSLYFMNQYYTCASEKGVYKLKEVHKEEKSAADVQKTMKEEDALFRSMKVNYMPDNNIDRVLELMYEKLEEKVLKTVK